VRRLILALLLTALAAELVVVVLTSPRFAIDGIRVTGTRIIPASQVVREIQYLIGSNIFAVKKEEIAAQLTRNPIVVGVRIRRHLPRTLIVEVTERRAHLVLNTGRALYEVDRSGIAFRKVSAANPNLPMVCCPFSRRIVLGERVRFPAFASARDCLIQAQGKKEFRVRKIAVDPDGHLCLNVREGFEVRLGRPDQIAGKLDLVSRLVQQNPEFRERGVYVDVTCFPEAQACKIAR
jgi:cell division protein FtsQ